MLHILEQSFVLTSAGWFILCLLAAAGYAMISQMLEDQSSAILGTPILVVGAALGQYLMREFGVSFSHDKTVNMGIGMAAGMFASAIVIVGVLWSWGKFANR